jgi:hypothetical protein
MRVPQLSVFGTTFDLIRRQARSISYRIGGAKFPVLKDLDTFIFANACR